MVDGKGRVCECRITTMRCSQRGGALRVRCEGSGRLTLEAGGGELVVC